MELCTDTSLKRRASRGRGNNKHGLKKQTIASQSAFSAPLLHGHFVLIAHLKKKHWEGGTMGVEDAALESSCSKSVIMALLGRAMHHDHVARRRHLVVGRLIVVVDGPHHDARVVVVVVPAGRRLDHLARLVAPAVSKVPAVVVRLHFGGRRDAARRRSDPLAR